MEFDAVLLNNVIGAVRTVRLPPVRLESDVVDAIKKSLDLVEIPYEQEVVVAPRSRVDLLVEGGIAIEVKRGKPNTRTVARQVERYAGSDMVTAIVLVSERGLIHHIVEAHGKPIEYVALSKNWGLST